MFLILPVIGAIAAAGLAAGASAIGQSKANKLQRELAQKQMDFQERMSSTSWQRSVADMKMAGINPALAYMKGGASSPGGAMAQVKDVLGPAVNSAMSAARLEQELKNMRMQEIVQGNQAVKLAAESYKTMQEGSLIADRPTPTSRTFRQQQQALQVQIMQMQHQLLKAGFSAARIKGSQIGGILNLLFGGGGAINPMTWGRGK